ncbi:MAG: hypothetical protein JW795_14440 [Chitinivibrionales bacterium]|nr:hypothetical protein [Chitinivibrionales bacterium]
MKKILCFCSIAAVLMSQVNARTDTHIYEFNTYSISHDAHGYDILTVDNTMNSAKLGEPMVPLFPVKLLLTPSHKAVSITVSFENPVELPQKLNLAPQQEAIPLSTELIPDYQKNEAVYTSSDSYPVSRFSSVSTHYMHGYGIAMAHFTPVVYYPLQQRVVLFQKAYVTITSEPAVSTPNNIVALSADPQVRASVARFVHNGELLSQYSRSTVSAQEYAMAIITVKQFQSEFEKLVAFYAAKNFSCKISYVEDITATGNDKQEKIRNFIISEVNSAKIKYVLLGGDVEHIPCRGMYVYVKANDGTDYTDNGIPADVYYAALDGNFNADGDAKWGEKDVDKVDFLPDIAVGRIPCSSVTELSTMLSKIMNYQEKPLKGQFNKPFLAGESLDASTQGGDGLNLLIGEKNDNGFTTKGIPTTDNIIKLYDNQGTWTKSQLLTKINEGTSAVYHSGHSNESTNMRLTTTDITDNNFSKVNGTDKNYTFVNTIGCICGAFDKSDCIGEQMVKIKNFAVAFVGNSRYGWYDNGTTDGPSGRLQRLFVHALYTEKILRIGAAVQYSKVNFAPFIDAAGEFEPGARRWCYYCNNLLGDPAMVVWTSNDQTAIDDQLQQSDFSKGSLADFTTNTNGCHISLNMIKTAVICQVLDVKGRTITTLFKGTTGSEKVSLTWNTHAVARGTYFIQVKTGSEVSVVCVTVSR